MSPLGSCFTATTHSLKVYVCVCVCVCVEVLSRHFFLIIFYTVNKFAQNCTIFSPVICPGVQGAFFHTHENRCVLSLLSPMLLLCVCLWCVCVCVCLWCVCVCVCLF